MCQSRFFYPNKSQIRHFAVCYCLLLCERNTVLYQEIKNYTKWQQSHQYAAFDKMFLPLYVLSQTLCANRCTEFCLTIPNSNLSSGTAHWC